MSLADELLADLEEIDNDDLAEKLESIKEEPLETEDADITEVDITPMDIDVSVSIQLSFKRKQTLIRRSYLQVSSIRELCKLHDSVLLHMILEKIDYYVTRPRKSTEMIGNVETDPEYQLIVEANSIAADIDNEICNYQLGH